MNSLLAYSVILLILIFIYLRTTKINSTEKEYFVLNKYIEKFGYAAGISKFAETFKLVYILKDRSDVRRELDMELNPLISYEIKKQDDLWE